MDHWMHQSLMSSQHKIKKISSAVNVMSSPAVTRGRGQERHSQPSCSAALPGSTQIHPPQQQKKEEHKQLMFKSFLEATHPFQRSRSILSPSGDFTQIRFLFFFFFFLISSAKRTADPPPPRNPNQRLLCWKSYRSCGSCTSLQRGSRQSFVFVIVLPLGAALVQTELNWHGIASFIP